jgi:hypothetical protein
MQGRRGRAGPLLLWEGGFLGWIGLCYLIVYRQHGLTPSAGDVAITFAIFSLPSLVGGFIAWSLFSAGLRVRRESGTGAAAGGSRLLIAGLLIALLILAGVLGVMELFGSAPGPVG